MNNPWITLLSVVIGGVITAGATIWVEGWRERRKCRGVARAIASEVSAAITLLRTRKYLEIVQSYATAAQQGQIHVMKVRIQEEYFGITKQSLGVIGSLKGQLPELVARLLGYANAGMEDIHRMFDDPDVFKGLPSDYVVEHYTDLHAVFFEFIRIGEEIIQEVDTLYPRH